jgi:hypothetical protein
MFSCIQTNQMDHETSYIVGKMTNRNCVPNWTKWRLDLGSYVSSFAKMMMYAGQDSSPSDLENTIWTVNEKSKGYGQLLHKI